MSDQLHRIKRLYYETSRATIARDFDTAIDLLKSMTSEEERERATVYMEGLAQMRAEWVSPSRSSAVRQSAAARGRSGRSTRGGRRSP